MSEAETPLTDAAIFRYGCKHCGPYKEEGIEPKFARNLERQLDKAQKDTERLDWLLAHPWAALAANALALVFLSTWSRQVIDKAIKEEEQ